MAGSAQWTVGTTPTLLASCPATVTPGPLGWFSIANGTAATVYLGGGTAVSSTNGYPLAASGVVSGYLFPADQVFGICAAGSSAVRVLQTGG
jgi:hypothetical protein